MAKIVVFDSGLGSLSIIVAIQKICKCEIIYFADQANYPYGNKTKDELEKIIFNRIELILEKFSPDLIVIGSNTPTIMLKLKNKKIIGVHPPLMEAGKISKTNIIGILGSNLLIRSKELSSYIEKLDLPKNILIKKIESSDLIDLVESGLFLKNTNHCKNIIRKKLNDLLNKNNIDVVTLSSTHITFLKPILEDLFPNIKFLDPADAIANHILKRISKNQSQKKSLKIFATGDINSLQKKLTALKITNKINPF